MKAGRVFLVTGATRGIGRCLANELAARGYTVYGTGRSWSGDGFGLPFHPLGMDLTSEESVREAVGRLLEAEGRIDVLVNNAGVSLSGSVEETPVEHVRALFETNYLGMVRTIQAVLPVMREQGQGTIVNVGSAAGKIAVPFQAHYSASKFAVEGLTEALSHELTGTGIRVLLIEPGDVKTTIWDRADHIFEKDSPYTDLLVRFHAVKKKEMGQRADEPARVAREIADLIDSNTRRLRHPVASGTRRLLLLRKLLPDRIFLWAVRRNYRIKG